MAELQDARPLGELLQELVDSLEKEKELLQEWKVEEAEQMGEAREPLFTALQQGSYRGDPQGQQERELVQKVRRLIRDNLETARQVRDQLNAGIEETNKAQRALRAYFPSPQEKPVFIRKNL